MIEFYQTVMGKRYYEHDLPQSTKAMEELAKAIKEKAEQDSRIEEKLDKILEALQK